MYFFDLPIIQLEIKDKFVTSKQTTHTLYVDLKKALKRELVDDYHTELELTREYKNDLCTKERAIETLKLLYNGD